MVLTTNVHKGSEISLGVLLIIAFAAITILAILILIGTHTDFLQNAAAFLSGLLKFELP